MKTMRRWNVSLVAVLVVAACVAVSHAPAARAAANDRAVVTRKRVVILRTGSIVRQFPHKRRAVVTYPVVSGLSDARVLRKVRAALDLKNVFDTSLAEYRQDAWLEELDFKVNYNKNQLLDITFWQTGTAAYPDTHRAHFTISLRTGDVLKAADVFEAGALYALAGMGHERLLEEVRGMVKVVEEDGSIAAEDKPSLKDALSGLSFGVDNLDHFMVGDKGLTFLYDAGFPHAIQALEPDGEYFFSYAQLAPYVKRGGPLGRFVR
jgi:hypothetical protein